MEFNENEKRILLNAARESIRSVFDDTLVKPPDYTQYPDLQLPAGAFVTVRINSELRGCIGYIVSKTPLFETVCDAAKQAAFCDPRFFPLAEDEFEKINIEISVLSIPERIDSYDKIELGKHGLIVEESGNRGLLLPQVATENNLSLEKFLTAVCEKAFLPGDLWKRKQVNLSIFTAEIFSEKDEEEMKE